MNAWSKVGKKFLAAGQKVSDKIFLAIEVALLATISGKIYATSMIKTDSKDTNGE